MDNKVKIKEIADELGVKSKEILEICGEFSIEAKTHQSAISMDDAEKLMKYFMTGEKPASAKPEPVVEAKKRGAKSRATSREQTG